MAKKITNKLAHLPQEITIDRMEEHPHTLELFISFPAPEIRACPRCGSNDCVIKDSGRVQTVRHVTCSSTGVLLTFHKRRLKCKDCSSSFYEQPYWLHPSSRITLALYSDICRGLMTTHSIRDIALQNGVTGTMGNVDPANESASIPGIVYFAIDYNGEIKSYCVEISCQETRTFCPTSCRRMKKSERIWNRCGWISSQMYRMSQIAQFILTL